MLKQSYEQIRKELVSDNAFEINNLYGFLTFIIELVVYSIGFILLLHTIKFSVAYWILEIYMGFSLFRFYTIIHECSHKNLFRAKYLNNVVGSLASLFCLVPYIPWRNIHMAHHQWAGIIDKDPLSASLLDIENSTRLDTIFRLLWKLWIPLGLVNFVFNMYWKYSLVQLKKGNIINARMGFVSIGIILISQMILIFYLGILEYLILFMPMQCMFYWLVENITLPQHVGLLTLLSVKHPDPIPYYEQDLLARSINFPNNFAIFLNYNNNLHIEHHLFPNIPWYNLPKVKKCIQRCCDLKYNEIINFWQFITKLRQKDFKDIHFKALA
jgi:acyl-lipid omega-6 desaturase (Delta-12 desaturase)